MDVIHIGPLALPAGLLLAFGALFAAFAIGNRSARVRGVRVESLLWMVAGVGMAVARAAFVVRYRDLYAGTPLAMFDIRDRGFDLPVGAVAAVLTALWLAWRDPPRRRPLAAGAVALAGWLLRRCRRAR